MGVGIGRIADVSDFGPPVALPPVGGGGASRGLGMGVGSFAIAIHHTNRLRRMLVVIRYVMQRATCESHRESRARRSPPLVRRSQSRADVPESAGRMCSESAWAVDRSSLQGHAPQLVITASRSLTST